MNLKSEASLQIQKPIGQVYQAIIDPEHMTKYFISESNRIMQTGVDLLWKFPEFDDRFPITEVEVKVNESVSFVWDPETRVQITLQTFDENSTIVIVTEGEKPVSDDNLKWLTSNTGGWSNFLACLKAYLEYGIQLMRGAYEFMKESKIQ